MLNVGPLAWPLAILAWLVFLSAAGRSFERYVVKVSGSYALLVRLPTGASGRARVAFRCPQQPGLRS